MSTQSGRGRPGRVTVSRDTLSFLGGWGLMIYEAVMAVPFNTTVFLGGMVIAGVPGAIQAFALWATARMRLESSASRDSASPEQSLT